MDDKPQCTPVSASDDNFAASQERVSEIAKQASVLFLAQLGACAYCALTIASTKDSALIVNSASTSLPIIQTSVPLASFYTAVAVLLLCIFVYFQLTLQLLWEEISRLPLVLPDGTRRSELGRLWLTNPFLRDKCPDVAFCKLRTLLTIICCWLLVPLTLVWLWARYLVRHDQCFSIVQGFCLLVTLCSAVGFYLIGKGAFAQERVFGLSQRQKMLIGAGAVIGIVGAIVAPRFLFSVRTADLRNADLSNSILENLDLRGAQMNGANLTNVDFNHADLRDVKIDNSTRISNKWLRVVCMLEQNSNPYADSECARVAGLAWADLSQARLANVDLRGVSLVGANLQGADLTTADLSDADLRLADLTNAHLPKSLARVHVDGALGLPAETLYSRAIGVPAAIKNRVSEACITGPPKPQDYSHPTRSLNCVLGDHGKRPWLIKRLPNGFITIASAVSNPAACLDGSAFSEGAAVQMWDCGTEDDTQYWNVQPKTATFVSMEENSRGLCINGGGLRKVEESAYLQKCDQHNHEQEWQIDLPAIKLPTHVSHIAAHISKQQARDAELAAREFKVSPDGASYSHYGSPHYTKGHRYDGRNNPAVHTFQRDRTIAH
jgi:uncharacterized protein YjbI with pentapeptide repeats